MHVNMRRSGALTHRIERADARGAHRTARQLRRWRARYDARFAPAKSLRAAVRYLVLARRYLGRADLAVAAYHLGIRNVQRLVRSYGGEAPSYAELYFGSAPDRHARTWRRLASFGETSRDYYWKVLAAKRIMRLYRRDPAALRFESRQQARKNSAEEFMHPRFRTAQFARPRSLASAWRHRVLRAIPLLRMLVAVPMLELRIVVRIDVDPDGEHGLTAAHVARTAWVNATTSLRRL